MCISGGGIRSATFGLGALQGLAEHGLLAQFDYLSTVSGGGYIGELADRMEPPQPEASEARRPAASVAMRRQRRLAAPDPIQHLREYNSYMSPQGGAMSRPTSGR